jgi:hypothetical protein
MRWSKWVDAGARLAWLSSWPVDESLQNLSKPLSDGRSGFLILHLSIWHFGGCCLAPACHFQFDGVGIHSQVSSSGGGLPGRPEFERTPDACLILQQKFFVLPGFCSLPEFFGAY